jgi:hypothetical protein
MELTACKKDEVLQQTGSQKTESTVGCKAGFGGGGFRKINFNESPKP